MRPFLLLAAWMMLIHAGPAAAQQTRWYFAEGATGPGFEQDIIIVNPTAQAAQVRVTFLKGTGNPQVLTFELPPTTRKSIRVNAVTGLEATEVSTIVESLNGVPIAAERTMYWGGASKRGGHNSIGVEEPETEWYLAEGATGPFFHTYILLANPGATPATVTARFLKDNGTVVTRSYQVDANRRYTIDVNADGDMTNTSFGTHITSTQPVLVERAMYWSSFEGGSDANAVSALSTTWMFAEGTTGADFHTYLLLSNPGGTMASATVTFYPETGPTVTRSVSVGASSRTTIDANSIAELAGKNFATTVTSTVPIVAERAMYWGNFVDGHATAGVTQMATKWGFAEGRTGVHESVGFETFFLLLNSSSSPLSVRGTFYLDDGTGSVLDFVVPANSRYTLNAAEPPRMAGRVMSAFFEANAPFVAERATYWGADWYGGHGSTGIPWNGPIAAPAALPRAAMPTFTPAAGTYHADMTVALSTATPGAIMRYTRNGSEPDEGSTPYGGPIAISETTTIKAKAFHPDYQASVAATGVFTLQAEPPTFERPDGTYPSPTQFALSTSLPGGYIRYTTDGSEPNESSAIYSLPVPALAPTTLAIKARVYRYNWAPSATATAVYQITQGVLDPPVPTPAAGIYAPGEQVILSAQPGVVIRYTLDGADVTETSAVYTTALVLNEPATVKARAFAPNYSPSPLLTARYDMRVAQPELTPRDGPLPFGGSTVSLVSMNPELTYRYTLDNEDPTEQSPQFFGSQYVSVEQTLKVSAFKSGWLPSEPASTTFWSATMPGSPGTFTVSGGQTNGFNPISTSVSFNLQNAFLDPSSVLLLRDGSPSGQAMSVSHSTANGVVISSAMLASLTDGKNDLSIYAADTNGLEVYGRTVLWAGSRTAQVYVQRSSGAALPGAQVRLVLLEDEAVTAQGVTDGGGGFTAQNLPSSAAFRVEVALNGYHARTATLAPGASSVTVALFKNNLAFSDGTEGWQGPVESMAHSEASDPLEYCVGICPGGFRGETLTMQASPPAVVEDPVELNVSPCEPRCDYRQLLRQAVGASTNMDVLLRTGWLTTPRVATYTFTPTLGTRLVRVRYRIQSAEIMPHPPWNPVGLPIPDRYDVRLRSTTTNVTKQDAGTVSDLYWSGHVDQNQATAWRTLELPIEEDDESVELRLEVQNVWDRGWDTGIWVDSIEEESYRVDAFDLYDYKLPRHTDPGAGARLEYLSAARHTYYNGNTNVNGTIRIVAPAGAQISGISLEILKDATVIATGPLVNALAPQLLRTVGTDGVVSVTQSAHMFAINSAQFDSLDLNDEVNLDARVRVTFANGTVRLKDLGRRLIALTLYRGGNRYPARDTDDCLGTQYPIACGGDDWARPKTARFIAAVGQNTTWGDFSNMNGGPFPEHTSHQLGVDIDGFFPRYPDRDERTAQRMIDLLNQYGRRILRVLVTFPPDPRDPALPGVFQRAITGVRLNDGRLATEVIRHRGGHRGHFHWLLNLALIQ